MRTDPATILSSARLTGRFQLSLDLSNARWELRVINAFVRRGLVARWWTTATPRRLRPGSTVGIWPVGHRPEFL